MAEDPEMSEEYLLELLKQDAAKVSSSYARNGTYEAAKRPAGKGLKPNTRFLRNIIKSTDNHNAALKQKELGDAAKRLRDIAREEEEDKQKRSDDRDRYRDYDHDRRQARKRKREDNRPRRRNTSSPEPERLERSLRRSRTRSRSASPKRDRNNSYRSKHRRRRNTSSAEPETSSRIRQNDEHRSYEKSRHYEKKSKEHRHRRRSHSRDRRRSPREDDGKKRSSSRSSKHQRHSHKPRSSSPIPLLEARTASPQSLPQRQISMGKGSETPSGLQQDKSSEDDDDPLASLIGPLPPPPEPAPRIRGRGSTTYNNTKRSPTNPKLDADIIAQDEDWDQALEALRDRQNFRAAGAKRLLEAGFSREQVQRMERAADGVGGERDENDVVWSRKGEAREWDRGKIVDGDGDVVVKDESYGRLA